MIPVTHITFLGFTIAEPTTVLTDFMLAVMCFIFFFQLMTNKSESGIKQWQLFFLFMGTSTLIGGLTHGLLKDHSSSTYIISWSLMQIMSGVSLYFAQLATVKSITNGAIPVYRTPKKSVLLCRIQLVIFIISVVLFQNFLTVVINSTTGFLMVFYIQLLANKKGNHSAGWVALGIAISFLTAIVHALKISLNEWFTFKDFAHVIMMISLSVMFYGIGFMITDEEKISIPA